MDQFYGGSFTVLLVTHLGFILAWRFRRNDIADVIWGLGFVAAMIGAGGSNHELGLLQKMVVATVGIWALRLSLHIGRRVLQSEHEDTRYLNWRKQWGRYWLIRSYLQVFILQAILLILISLPIQRLLSSRPQEIGSLAWMGFSLWLLGLAIESTADRQLRRFKLNPANRGKIMDQGLWGWSRHPNYFGEVTQWWGIYFMTFTDSYMHELWWLVLSPLLLTFLILKVSGVPMLEKLMEGRPGFAEYQRRTSVFFPWPPKN